MPARGGARAGARGGGAVLSLLPTPTATSAASRPRWRLMERLGDEAGARLTEVAETGDGPRWLLLELPAAELGSGVEESAAALVASGVRATVGEAEPHLALPRLWLPPDPAAGTPAGLAVPRPGRFRATALLEHLGGGGLPELLGRLLLAETLAGLAAAHRLGLWHGLLGAGSLWLAGAPPARLIADCPRDPKVSVVGFGVLALLTRRARAVAIEAAATAGLPLAPEVRSGQPGPLADVWAAAGLARALLAGESAPLDRLLAAMQQPRPELRPSAEEAAVTARELALAGLASWRRGAPCEQGPLPAPPAARRWEPRLPAPSRRPPVDGQPDGRQAEARVRQASPPAPRWAPPVLRHVTPGGLRPFAPLGAAGSTPMGLWLSLAPTALAGILSVLLAVALLFAVR
jgi:hypothetical protein